MANLKGVIEQLANDFARGVVAALRGASIEDVYELAGASGARSSSTGRGPGRPRGSASSTSSDAAAASGGRRGRRTKTTSSGRLARRSAADIEKQTSQIAELLSGTEGMRSEEIRAKLSLDKRELPRLLKHGVEAGLFSSKGQKRATTYHLKKKRGG